MSNVIKLSRKRKSQNSNLSAPAEIIPLNIPPKLEQLADNLWIMRLDNSSKSNAQAKWLIDQLRANGMMIPDHMKGE